MAKRKAGETRSSGTGGGTDVEPLRGGMHEVERGAAGPHGGAPERPVYPGEEHERETAARREPRRETTEKKDPPAPYHPETVPAEGLAPRVAPGEGTAPQRPSAGEVEATAGRKLHEERRNLEREAGNAPRRDPSSRATDE